MRLAWFLLAALTLVGFAMSAWVHIEAVRGLVAMPLDGSGVSLVFAGIGVVFVPYVLAMWIEQLRGGPRPMDVMGRGWTVALIAVFLYAIGNLLWCAHQLGAVFGGGAQSIPLETPAQQALALRAFSGGWLLFFIAPLAYFLRRGRRK